MIGDVNDAMDGWMIGGPSDTAFLPKDSSPRLIEAIIYGMCKHNGDDPDDYTVTKVLMNVTPHPQAVVTPGR